MSDDIWKKPVYDSKGKVADNFSDYQKAVGPGFIDWSQPSILTAGENCYDIKDIVKNVSEEDRKAIVKMNKDFIKEFSTYKRRLTTLERIKKWLGFW